MEISKTKIEKRTRTKSNPELVRTILALKKVKPEFAKLMALPRRKMITLNVEELDKACAEGDKIIIPGKILGNGFLTKKVKVVAFSASKDAQEKIKNAKGEFVEIVEEIKKNKELNDLKLLKYE